MSRRLIAHLGAVEILSPVPERTGDFFQRLLGMSEVGRSGASTYLRTFDDYQLFSVKVTGSASSGIGSTWLRAEGPEELELCVAALSGAGREGSWAEPEMGLGPSYQFTDPDGHGYRVYWETSWFRASEEQRPALKNQPERFPGRGAGARRIDHVNYLCADVPQNARFVAEELGGQISEQIVLDDGTTSASWHHFGEKTYDLVYTGDWTGSHGRLHHVAFAVDQREDILRSADLMLEAGIEIETGPHKHAIQQTFFLYVFEPGGNRIELCNAGARLLLAPDWPTISWSEEERAKGQAWGMKTIESFHRRGTPPVAEG